jgi:hypothetical protein
MSRDMISKRQILLSLCLPLFCLCLAASHTRAQDAAAPAKPAAFFEALYDVPVMPGLEEAKDQALLFDKPDGRIASVVAASKTLNAADINRFYAESLPQLGWKKSKENQYVRGSDRLTLELVKKPPLTIVHFTLAPDRP